MPGSPPSQKKVKTMIEMKTGKNMIVAAALAVTAFYTVPAHAQMNNQPWSFTPQNRAGIASLIRSVEEGGNGAVGVSAAGGIVNLVCGGTSDGASATANNTCVILNNSEGAIINIDQDSEGDQTAKSEENTDVEQTVVGAENIDDVLETLNGTN